LLGSAHVKKEAQMSAELNELAERTQVLGDKIKRVIINRIDLSASGQATAIAMLVTLDLGLFDEVAAAIRSKAASQ
jgi:hypothetical protein